ncbi:MAG: C4-dicarboxylate ABC transporter, partial [Lachnospiraceae bacterium]
ELFLEDEKKLKGELQEKGMEFVDVDQKLFAEKAVPGVEAILTEKQKALYDKIKAVEE